MRVRSTTLGQLQLRIPSGWYELASHMAWDEIRELVRLLERGLEGVEHVLELDWSALQPIARRLVPRRSILALRIPSHVPREAGQAALRSLGPVLVGLVQYQHPDRWADVAWQERYVKAPLLSLLKRDFHDQAHPLAAVGLANLPLDELARLTPEPIELLAMLDDTISHRLAHAQFGTEPEDWLRSVRRAAADRLARRLLEIPNELRARALDLLLNSEQGSFSAADDGEASDALCHRGLAWRTEGDVLVGALAQEIDADDVICRLVERLPETAWSKTGMAAIRRAVPRHLPALRATLATPEPPYGVWPAIVPVAWFGQLRTELAAAIERDAVRERLETMIDAFERRASRLGKDDESEVSPRSRVSPQNEVEQNWLALFDACEAALAELDDERLRALDVQRGRIHRFDAVDAAMGVTPSGPKLAAWMRWLGVAEQLDDARISEELAVFAGAVAEAMDLAKDEPELHAALDGLAGDIHALRGRYRDAEASWARAESGATEELARFRLASRRTLASLRLDDWHGVNSVHPNAAAALRFDPIDRVVYAMIDALLDVSFRLSSLAEVRELYGNEFERLLDQQKVDHPSLAACRVAAAIELQNWPKANRVARTLEQNGDGQVATRSRLVWAWVKTSLGDIDVAQSIFTALSALAARTGDRLLEALSERGRALVSFRQGNLTVVAPLERAFQLERELDLPDAAIVGIELAQIRALNRTHPRTEAQLKAQWHQILTDTDSISPSFLNSLSDTIISFHIGLIQRHRRERVSIPTDLLQSFENFWKLASPSLNAPTSRRRELIESLIDYAKELGPGELGHQLLAAARAVAAEDPVLLARIDQHTD